MSSNYDKSNHRKICGNGKNTKEVKPPQYLCKTCTKCVNSRCTFYNRQVEVDYNKCFNHSNYSPIATSFRSPDNLEEIVRNEEKQIA